MLEFFRRHSRLVMVLLFVLVVPSFVFFGVADYQSFNTNEVPLVKVNKQKITRHDFDESWTRRLSEWRESQGQAFDIGKTDTPEARELWLNSLTDRMVVEQTALDDKLSAPSSLVRMEISQLPQAQENGRFSMEAYNRFLTGVGMTAEQYEAYVRHYESLGMVVNPIADNAILPAVMLGAIEKSMTEERSVRFRFIRAEQFVKEVTLTDDELKQWYDKHNKAFEIPDYVNLEYILLNQDAVVAQVQTPAEAELETYYKNNLGRFSTVERRHLKHIQVTDLAKAQEIATEAKQDPARFDALVKEFSQDAGTKNTGGDLGMIRRGEIPELDTAVFTLPRSGISDPVQMGNHYHVFQVVAIEAGSVKPFAEVKEEVTKEVRLQLASDRFARLATELTHLVQDRRDSLTPVVDQLGLKVQEVAGISRTGLLSKEEVGDKAASGTALAKVFDTPRVREAAFSAEVYERNLNSGAIELSPSEFLVIRVKDKVAKYIPTLEQVKARAESKLKMEKASALAQKEGDSVLAQARLNASTDDFEPAVPISRIAGNLPDEVLSKVMDAPGDKLPFYVGLPVDSGYLLARIESITPEKPELKNVFQQVKSRLAGIVGEETGKAYIRNLRGKNKVEFLPAAKDVMAAD